MESIDQIQRGALAYISREIVPLVSVGKGILIEALAPTVLSANLRKYMALPWILDTGLVEDGTKANVDEIMRLVKTSAEGRWPVEIAGFRFGAADLDKLYQYIKEAR